MLQPFACSGQADLRTPQRFFSAALQNLSQQTGLHSAEAAEGYIRSAKAYSRAGEEIRMAVTGKIDFAHQNIPWK